METISRNYVKNLLKKRRAKTHKGTYGKVLIIAGSKGMAGAAVLAARSALRSGAGLVCVGIDEALFPVVQTAVTEATCMKRQLTEEVLSGFDSVVIGPGLGMGEDGVRAVCSVTENCKGNVVMDADALNIAARNPMDFREFRGSLVITPHPGEASRLLKIDTHEVEQNREKAASALSRLTGGVCVLKGHETIVCFPEKGLHTHLEVRMNPTGNPGMATGGSGDVLSGIIGSFMGQGMNGPDAALAGVYVHGYAGDLAKEDLGEYGIIAGDIALYTAHAINKIQKS